MPPFLAKLWHQAEGICRANILASETAYLVPGHMERREHNENCERYNNQLEWASDLWFYPLHATRCRLGSNILIYVPEFSDWPLPALLYPLSLRRKVKPAGVNELEQLAPSTEFKDYTQSASRHWV